LPLTCFPFYSGEWVCRLTIKYPFIKHIPIVTVMSGSHVSGCAMMSWNTGTGITFTFAWLSVICDEREASGYKYRVAPGTARTGNGDNDTPVRP